MGAAGADCGAAAILMPTPRWRIPSPTTVDRTPRPRRRSERLLPIEVRHHDGRWRVWCGLCRMTLSDADGNPLPFGTPDAARATARLHAVTHDGGGGG